VNCLVNLNRRDAVSTLAEGLGFLGASQAKKLPRNLGERRREGGPLSPPTLARRAAWRVISILSRFESRWAFQISKFEREERERGTGTGRFLCGVAPRRSCA